MQKFERTNMKANIVEISEIYNKKLKSQTINVRIPGVPNRLLRFSMTPTKHMKAEKKEYRIGSTILHKNTKDENEKYDIIDGQQRLTTLTILLKLLGEKEKLLLLGYKFNSLSFRAIADNGKILKQKVESLSDGVKDEFKEFILNKCTMVEIIVDKQQDAFSYFDSQNTRGRALEVHDLLKAYHLRHMSNIDEAQKVRIVSEWESQNSDDIKEIFGDFLFPIIRWQRGECGLGYSKDHIDIFKGIDCASSYNVTRYNKAAIGFLEKSDDFAYIFNSQKSSKFLLTQDLLSGKHFFNYTAHYLNLYRKADNFIRDKYDDKVMPRYKTGDKYTARLFTCLILAFVDRFGFEELGENICDFFIDTLILCD